MDKEQRIAAVEHVLAAVGQVDVLVNNAGLGGDSKSVEESSDESYREHMEANFIGCVHMAQLVLPTMRARQTGAIVNVTSTHGRWTTGCHSVCGRATRSFDSKLPCGYPLFSQLRGTWISSTCTERGFKSSRL